MYSVFNSIKSVSSSANLRMGLAFAKEAHALFLKKYCSNCSIRLKEICDVEKGTIITEEEARPGFVPVVAGGKDFAYYHNTCNRDRNVITISASGASSGFVNYWNVPIWASDCITIKSKDESNFITKYIYYILKTIQADIYLLQKGADQPHVYPDDIGSILIPDIFIDIQRDAIARIERFEEKADCLQKQLKSTQSIIDYVFQREFSLDYETFESLNAVKKYRAEYSSFSNNPDIRFSAKFHRDAGTFVMSQLTDLTDKKIKHFISEPIILGASISPEDYSEDGEYYYISMATIKGWSFNSESANTVSKEYSDSKMEKTVCKNDIILARSGEGTIGKVALIDDEDIQGIFADFTMRIRLKDYNPEFAYYYFRTSYFQYLIEVYKKGLGNNTNIFPIVIQEFPMIDITLDEQQRIVDEIHTEIDKQNEIREKIASLRAEIEKIIEDTFVGGKTTNE